MEIKDFDNIYGYKYKISHVNCELKITLFLCGEKPFKRHTYTNTPARNQGTPVYRFTRDDGTEGACILSRTDINSLDFYSLRYRRVYYTFKGYALPATPDEIQAFVKNIISYRLLPEAEDKHNAGNVNFIDGYGEPFEAVVEKRKVAVNTLSCLNT